MLEFTNCFIRIHFSSKKNYFDMRSVSFMITVLVISTLLYLPNFPNSVFDTDSNSNGACLSVPLLQNKITSTQVFLPSWDNRILHHINSAGEDQINYQIKFIVHFGYGISAGSDVFCNNSCKTNFTDIRFTRADGISI